MKKNYIVFTFLITFSFVSYGQIIHKPIYNFQENDNNISESNSALNTTPFWYSDFSDPSLWTIDNNGQPIHGWSIDANVDSWYLQSFNSSSGGAFAELGNGDPTIQGATWPIQVEYTLTTASPINVFDSIGSASAILSFEEYGARFNDLQAVQVSIDGINFVTVADNLSYTVTSQSNGSNPYPNPALREVNLQPYIALNPSSVWIRFSWTTNFPNQASDPNVWVAYGWLIDDVSLRGAPANRVTIQQEVIGGYWVDFLNSTGAGNNAIYGLDYSVTPLSQLATHSYSIEALVINEGTSDQTVTLKYDVSGTSVSTGASSPVVLAPGDSAYLAASYLPTNTGSYTIDVWAEADSAGAGMVITMSDVLTRQIQVTDFIYGKDDLSQANPGKYILGGMQDQNHITSRYEMYANENLYSTKVFIHQETQVGAEVKAIIYEVDTTASNNLIFYNESDKYTIQASDLGSWIDIPFLTPVALYNGYAYEFGVVGFQGPDTSYIGMTSNSMYNGEHSLYDELGLSTQSNGTPTWYYITSCPMVRMNFDAGNFNSVNENSSIFNIYPNPTNGNISIDLSQMLNCSIVVNNVLGQTVYTSTVTDLRNTIDLSSLEKGLYTIELRDNELLYSEKIILE